jgi:hypothetical protein
MRAGRGNRNGEAAMTGAGRLGAGRLAVRRIAAGRTGFAAGVCLLLGLLGAGQTVHAQSKVGSTVGSFLRIEPTARGAALGNAGSALPGGIDAVYYNTGAIGLLERPTVTYAHSFWFADISFDYAAAALPVSGVGSFFASVTALNSGEIDVRTVDQPLGTGERYTVSNVALGLGYGMRITSRFAAGIQANYVTERIWHTSIRMLTFNLGTVYRLSESGLLLGFCLANVGSRARFTGGDLAIQYDADPDTYGGNSSLPAEQYTDSFPLPGVFRIGLSLPIELSEESGLLLLAEALHPNDNSESANVGVEWTLRNVLALRGGYQTLFQTDRELGLTLGFGVLGRLGDNRYQVDYAWAGHDHLEDTHRLSVVLIF